LLFYNSFVCLEILRGKESDIINGIIVMGTGHFFVIIAGILAVFAYAVEKVYRKQEPPLGATTNK
jgi:hypothetical protein